MNFNRTHVASLLISAMLVMSVLAGAGAAALTYDDETTNTPTTSDWTGGETITDLDNASKEAYLEVQSGNASSASNFVLRGVVNDSDSPQDEETVYETAQTWTIANESNGHYSLNVTYADIFSGLEREAGQTVTIDVVAVYNESESDEEMNTIQIHAENGDNPRLIADDRGEYQEVGSGLFSLSTWTLGALGSDEESPEAAKIDQTVDVNGDNTTTLTIGSGSGNFSDALDEATSDTSSGDFMTHSYVVMNGHLVPVFDSQADAEWLDTDERAYGVADSDDGTITVENANDTFDSDTTEVDVVAASNAQPSFRDQISMLRNYDAGFISQARLPSIGETFEDSGL